MKNLLVVSERLSQVQISALTEAVGGKVEFSLVVLDAPSHRLFIITKQLTFIAYSLTRHAITYQCSLLGEELLEANDEAVGMHYLPELELVHIATAHGNLLTLSPDGATDPSIVGGMAVGIAAMAWSPDEELCVIYNRASQVVVMTKDFDVMYEIDIFKTPAASTTAKSASSSSTSAPPTAKSSEEVEALYARFGFGSISWRGDGQFFVLSALNPHTSERVLIVYDRQLEQQSISGGCKPAPLDGSTDGMSTSVVWRPSGNLIFTPAHRMISSDLTKRELWMWEKNGLRHGEIALGNVVKGIKPSSSSSAAAAPTKSKSKPKRKAADDEEDEGEDEDNDYNDEVDESANMDESIASAMDSFVSDLAWNADSDVLAVKLEDKSTGAQSVVLYTTGNYHWYLKQEFRPQTQGAKIHMQWHAEDARRLLLVESTGLTRFIELVWDVSVNEHAQSRLTGVIDGQSALLTPLAKTTVPPPMSTWKVNVPVKDGKINGISMRASPEGVKKAKEGTSKFTLPNQALEATAFLERTQQQGIGGSDAFSQLQTPFSPTSDLLLSTSAGKLFLLEDIENSLGNAFNSGVDVSVLKAREITLKSEDFPLGCLRSIQWLEHPSSADGINEEEENPHNPSFILAVESTVGQPDALVELEVYDGEIQSMYRTPCPAGASVLRLVQRPGLGGVFIELSDGRVTIYIPAVWQVSIFPIENRVPILESPNIQSTVHLPCACPWFDVVLLGNTIHAIGKDSLGKLYISQTLLTPQCSSFLANQHPDYLVFTILGQQNAMFLLDKRLTLEENMSLAYRSDPHNVRLIERGGILTVIIPSLTLPRVILQMPRGNLEAIYPRNFNLSSINHALSNLKLKEAFVNLRRNKIDPNLLFDHFGIETFPKIAREFVRQIGELDTPPGQGVELLNLFLSALTDDSSLENQYVKYVPLPLTDAALNVLASGSDSDVRDPAQEIKRQVAVIRAQASAAAGQADGGAVAGAHGGDEDVRSDAGSLDSGHGGGAGDNVQAHHAIGEAQPYNYVPRKPGQPRRRAKQGIERRAASANVKSKEESKRETQKADRAAKEKLAEAYENSLTESTLSRSNKINFVCDLLRSIFLEEESRFAQSDDPALKAKKGRYTLCILTTYLKNEPKNYDAALQMVKRMREEEVAVQAQQPRSQPTQTKSSRVSKPVGKEQSTLENKSLIYSGYTGALQYMIFLSDIQTLYKCALGIYDFELVRLVAQYSHMDPREYMSFLEKLQSMDAPPPSTALSSTSSIAVTTHKRQPNFQHYHIDIYLGRWERALEGLIKAWHAQEIPHDEEHWNLVLDLVKSHPELYTRAIELVTPEEVRDQTRLVLSGGGGGGSFGHGGGMRADPYGLSSAPFDPTGGLPAHFLNPSLAPSTTTLGSASKQQQSGSSSSTSGCTPSPPQSPTLTPYFSLLKAYATHLGASKSSVKARHAAHAFLLCQQWKLALKALQEAGEWKECISLAYQLGYAPEEIQQLAYDLSGSLRSETKTALAAAQLLIDYCDDVDEGVVILIGAELWFDSLRVCYSKQRSDLIETHVQPEILKAFTRHMKHIQTHRTRYLYAVKRLRVIRRVKLLFPPQINSMDPTSDNLNARDDDLMSIVSGATQSTAYSQTSVSLSEASAFSGRSTSTVASTSSIFSIQSDDRREMTADERRIARHKAKLERNRASKRVKEGSIYEEDMMIKEVIETTPMDKHKERMSELVHALLHFGYVDQSRTLQFELDGFLKVVAEQEALPMPMMENPTPEQREQLIRYWNWPQMAHPDRALPPKTEHLIMPFLFAKPSTKQAAADAEAAKIRAQASSDAASAPVGSAFQPSAVLDDDEENDGGLFGVMI